MTKKNKKTTIGLEQLRAEREKTIERWSKSGLLEGLDGNIKENVAQLFENQLAHMINESGDTSQFDKINFPIIRRAINK